MIIGIKYCGGCRVTYDRRAVREQIERHFREGGVKGLVLLPAIWEGSYDSMLVFCGCQTKCVSCERYSVRGRIIFIDHALSEVEYGELRKLFGGEAEAGGSGPYRKLD